jgi:hypothetical protein
MSDSTLFTSLEHANAPQKQIAVDCTQIQGLCQLPLGNELLDANFAREGNDLLVTASQTQVIAENYFSHSMAPTLISETGKKVNGHSVETLTKAESYDQYAGPVAAPEAIGSVEKIEGSVVVKRNGAEVELSLGDPVFQNDVVQTAEGAKIGITFNDQSVFSLGSDARMTLDSFVYDGETGEGSSSINVIKGMFKFVSGEIAANNPGEMQVETPVATIGIRGTTGGGSVQGEGMDNQFYLEPNADGTVGWFDVVTDQATTSLNQPNTVVVIQSFNQAPPAPEFVAPEQLEQQFKQIIDFSPAGKYQTREAANESNDPSAGQTQQPQEAEAKQAEPKEQGQESQEASSEAEAGQEAEVQTEGEANAEGEASAEVAGDNEATTEPVETATESEGETAAQDLKSEEISDTPQPMDADSNMMDADSPEGNTAEMQPPQGGENEPKDMMQDASIKTTMSGEEKAMNSFDQAQMMMEGTMDGMPQNGMEAPNNQPAGENMQAAMNEQMNEMLEQMNMDEAAGDMDMANTEEMTVEEEVQDGRNDLLNQIFTIQERENEERRSADDADSENDGRNDGFTGGDSDSGGITTTGTDGGSTGDLGDLDNTDDRDDTDGDTDNVTDNPVVPITDPLIASLTGDPDNLTGTVAADVVTISAATDLSATDNIDLGSGNDALVFDGLATADVSGLGASISGIDKIVLTEDASVVTVDKDFVDQGDFGTITIDYQNPIITQITADVSKAGNFVEFYGNEGATVNFISNPNEINLLANKVDSSINFNLDAAGGINDANAIVDLIGGKNTVVGSTATDYYLELGQKGGEDHSFSLAKGDNFVWLENVIGTNTTVSYINGTADYAEISLLNSNYLNVNVDVDKDLFLKLKNTDNAFIRNGSTDSESNSLFELIGHNNDVTIDGGYNGMGTDTYVFENYTGNLDITSHGNSIIELYDDAGFNSLTSGANVNISHSGNGGPTFIKGNIDFDNFALNFSGSPGNDLTLTTNGGDLILKDIVSNSGKYKYEQIGKEAIMDLGIVINYDIRDLTSIEYQSASFADLNGIFSIDGISNIAPHFVVGSVLDDDITVDGVFQRVEAGDGSDTITLETATSNLNAYNEESFILAGGGNDLILAVGAIDDVSVDGGSGFDTIKATSYGGTDLTLDLSGLGRLIKSSDSSVYLDQINNVEGFILGSGDDTFIGDSFDNFINGGVGADDINGGGGNNTVSYITSATLVDVDLTRGALTDQIGGDATGDRLSNIQNIIGSANDDNLTGDANANELRGMMGNDHIIGGAGNDMLDGGFGDDSLEGGAGDDFIHGSGGYDSLDGGTGYDIASYIEHMPGDGVNVDINSAMITVSNASGMDNLTNFEEITTTNEGDTVTVDSTNIILNTDYGMDNVTFEGTFSASTDVYLGGDDDIAVIDATADGVSFLSIDGGRGDDILVVADSSNGLIDVNNILNFEILDLNNGTIENFATATDMDILIGNNRDLQIDADSDDNFTLSSAWNQIDDDGAYSTYFNGTNVFTISSEANVTIS